MEVLQPTFATTSKQTSVPARVVPMRAASLDESCSPSTSTSSRSLRSWFFLGPSLCKNVAAYSPAAFSVSSSPSSSQRSSFRSSSGRLNSFRQDESVSKCTTPTKTRSTQAPKPPGSSKNRSTSLSIVARVNSKKIQKLEKVLSPVPPPLVASTSKAINLAAGGYALALANLANSTGLLQDVNKDIDNLSQLLENEELYEFMTSPTILDTKKKSIITTIAEEVEFHEYTITFLNVLVDRKRTELVKDVIQEFEKIYNDLTDTQVATVTSAVKMEPPELELVAIKIKNMSGAQHVRAKNVVDPSLIAGYVINYHKNGLKHIDMSVKGQMDRLASQFEYSGRDLGAY